MTAGERTEARWGQPATGLRTHSRAKLTQGWRPSLVVFLTTLGLVGCANTRDAPEVAFASPPHLGECQKLFDALDRLVDEVGVTDVQEARIRGFPFLRVNRFLASYRAELDSDAAFAAWVQRMRHLDQQGRNAEIANLSPDALRRAPGLPASKVALTRNTERCGASLQQYLLGATEHHARLLTRARVPTTYNLSERVFGLYPISSLFVYEGVKRLQARFSRDFSVPLDQLPVEGTLVRFTPERQGVEAVRTTIVLSSDNPLEIPEPRGGDRRRLLHAFAPIWEIDVTGDYDRIGVPHWDAALRPTVDITQAASFAYISYARWQGRALLQLNYVVWFPERPQDSAFDLLGGRLDGITWRVTLAADGQPLAYDAMHNCGCYHMFFPTSRLRQKPPPPVYEEPLFIPSQAPHNAGRIVLRIATRTHYLQRVYASNENVEDRSYAIRNYSELRSIPLANGRRRSLFLPNGLVPMTERGERWLLWPMGVREPGAMRQRGHHATAFVGRRVFDDPHLLGRYFDILAAYR